MYPSPECEMTPTMVSDPLSYGSTNRFGASRALTDSDESHWIGKDNEGNAHFIYDLGCVTSLSKLVLHNSRNGDYRDRQAFCYCPLASSLGSFH